MTQTTTNKGRQLRPFPDLNFDTTSDGGAALHAALAANEVFGSDNTTARWTGSITIANGATSPNFAHNFGVSKTQLRFAYFESNVQVPKSTSDVNYTVNEIDANTITFTNNSGVSKTFYCYILPYDMNVAAVGGINYVKNKNCDGVTDITSANITVAATTTAGEVLLGSSSIKITSNSTPQGYVSFTLDTIDPYFIGKVLNFSIKTRSLASYTANDMYVVIYDETGAAAITTTQVNIPLGDYEVKGFFIVEQASANVAKTYTLRIYEKTSPATAGSIAVDDPKVSPVSNNYCNVSTMPQLFTMTIAGFGTSPAQKCFWYREGKYMYVHFCIDVTNVTGAGSYNVQIPSGYTVDTPFNTDLQSGNFENCGIVAMGDSSTGAMYNGIVLALASTGIATFYGGNGQAGWNSTVPVTVNTSHFFRGWFKLPIVGWDTNIQVADRALEEYAFNTSTSTTASDTTSFGNGAMGAQIQNITAFLERTIRFQTPIQPTDFLMFEVSTDRKIWLPLYCPQIVNGNNFAQYTYQAPNTYGAGEFRTNGVATDLVVRFGQYAFLNASTYGGVGNAYSEGSGAGYWRVKKVSSGASVGFPISPANLVKSIVRYVANANVSFASGSFVIMDYALKSIDTKNEVTTGAAWKFTAKEAGYYRCGAASMLNNAVAWPNAAAEHTLAIYKNGSVYSYLCRRDDYSTSTSVYPYVSGEDIVYLAAGDYIDFRVIQTSGSTINSYNGGQNHCFIEQLG